MQIWIELKIVKLEIKPTKPMKRLFRSTSVCLGLLILLSLGFSVNSFGFAESRNSSIPKIVQNTDLYLKTKQFMIKADNKRGVLIKSKKFVFYVNKNQKQLVLVFDRLSFSKADCIIF